jgi:hypothetical protein
MSFQVGDKVYWSSDSLRRVLLENLTHGDIQHLYSGTVKFISEKELGVASEYSNNIRTININHVYSQSDIDQKKDLLQKEFEKIEEEVRAKIAQGVELINQANRMMEDSGLDLVEDYDLDQLED